MVIYPETYNKRLEELKTAREKERALFEAANNAETKASAEVAATEEA
jgi:hypothetical protein